jgi:Ca2+:H+ antiporter
MPIDEPSRVSVTREGVLVSLRFLMLAFLPVAAILLYFVHSDPVWVFVTGVMAVAALADWVRRATEQVAAHAGPAIGGLVTISFGSIAELLLAFFVLTSSDAAVVRAQIVGSIIGTSLLGLGLAMFAGGMKFERQKFERAGAGRRSSMLILIMVALLLPAIFNLAAGGPGQHHASPIGNEGLSLAISVVLLLLYAGGLVYTLVTRRDVFSSEKEGTAGGTNWSLTQALADLLAAVTFGRQNRMSLVMSICVGSAIQVALVIAPLLVLASWAIGRPMTLVFSNPLDLFAIAGTVFIVNAISSDGETNWFEGLLLIGVYVLLAMAFFFMGST